jgi:nicotinate-nucleotide--dimethylbenzimidazole phosphoribosyltransferase
MTPSLPADLQATLARICPLDAASLAAVQERLDRQAKPPDSLGRLEEFARRYVAATGRDTLRRKTIFTFAGDHGVAGEGVSAFPREVTAQMVYNFLAGGAAINALARHAGAEVVVVDMGVDHAFGPLDGLLDRKLGPGTANFAHGPAMSREQALQALATGIALAQQCRADGVDLVGTGDMGIANTTPSAAIVAVFAGLPPAAVTHRGTGIDDAALARKIRVIEQGLAVNRPDPGDPVDVLAKVGGFEIGGIAGLIVGCAAERIPVVVDGFISTAGALVAAELAPTVRDYLFAAHRSVEIGHAAMLDRLGVQPMLDLKMRLGEGTGAALGMTLVEAALRMLREVRTFDEAGVAEGRTN